MSYDHLDMETRVYLLYCDIGNYRHWVKESINFEKFFSNFDKLKIALEELTHIKYEYYSPTPNEELDDLVINEQKYIQQFLTRSWINIVSTANKLKTEKGKTNKIKTFFDSLEPYKGRFSEDTLNLVEKARNEQPDYSLKPTSKVEKDKLFLINTEKTLDLQNSVMDNIATSNENYAWFYQNNYLLPQIFKSEIEFDVIYDITRLMLSGFDYKKASRFLRVKYGIDTKTATQLYITACNIANSHSSILHYLKSDYKQYVVITHSNPCPVCQKYSKKIFNYSDAKIGVNYPPFCQYNCSTTGVYIEGVTEIE